MRTPVTLPTVTVLDSFVDANSTAIDAHTPDTIFSGKWTQTASNSFYIQSNTIQPNRYTSGDLATIETGLSDFSLAATVTPFNSSTNRGDPGILFRYVDANNYWLCYPESDGPIVVINKVVAGVSTTMVNTKNIFSSGTKLKLRIDCYKNNITLYINDLEIVSITDSFNNTATQSGIYCRKSNAPGSKPSWNSFQVTPFYGQIIYWPEFTEMTPVTPLLDLGVSGFDSVDINDPSVQFDSVNNRWVMCYTGNDGTSVQDLGNAYATNIQGPYVKDSVNNPVLNSAANDTFGMNGGLVKLGSTWYYYYGTSTGGKIDCATSTDLITWTKQGTVLQGTGINTWDSVTTFDVYARLREDKLTIELWYTGKNTNPGGIGRATSTDGLTFTRDANNPIIAPQLFSRNNFGEPCVWMPKGYEDKTILVTFDGGITGTGGAAVRFLVQALTFNGGKVWHYRTMALAGNGSGWQSVQVFDPEIIVSNGIMYLFHSGSNTTGSALNINAKIGYAQATFNNFLST